MLPEEKKLMLSGLLVLIGSLLAGLAVVRFTGDPLLGVLVFGAAIGLFGGIL